MTDRPNYLQDKQWQKGFALLGKYNLSFDLQIYDHQIADINPLVNEFPNIKIIIEHLAWPLDLTTKGYEKWKQRIDLIAKYPNVFMKLSGIGWVFKKSKIDYK